MTRVVFRRTRSWNVPESRAVRPDLVLAAVGLIGMLLIEVWGSARVTELSFALEQSRSALAKAHVRLEYAQASYERRTTRAELSPLASGLGLAPVDAQHVVALPASYLESEQAPSRGSDPALLAWAERASRAIVPEATARDRAER